MPVNSVAAFVEAVRENRLLDAAHLQELTDDYLEHFPDESLLATDLVRRGWLTNFQANLLLQGHGQSLLLGQYVLLDRLGEGGMGEVFKARHQRMKRTVALKVIRKDKVANVSALQRFNREIEAAAQLMHPNIVLAYDAAEEGEIHYFVMEYVRGVDLAKLVRETGALGVGQACDYVRQAAFGLQHAYERGLIHRDIKPANLLVAQGGSDYAGASASAWETGIGPAKNAIVKILDMGLARLRQAMEGEQATLTQEGMVMGTPDYIAPEQAVDSRTVDIRADIYSLGCTFYFLLTGSVPFPGGTIFEKLYKHRYEEPVPVEQVRPEVPAEVGAIVRRMMAKEPAKRYPTPGEIAAALQPFAKPDEAPRLLPDPAPAEAAVGTCEVTPPAPVPARERVVQTMPAPTNYFPATLEQAGSSMPTHIGQAAPKVESRTDVSPPSVAKSGRRPTLNPDYASLQPEDMSHTGSGAGPTARLSKPAPVAPISPVSYQPSPNRLPLLLGGAVGVLAVCGVILWATVFRPVPVAQTSESQAVAHRENASIEPEVVREPAKKAEELLPKAAEPAKPMTKPETVKQPEPPPVKVVQPRKDVEPPVKGTPPTLTAKAPEDRKRPKEPSVTEVAPKVPVKKEVQLGVVCRLGGENFRLKNAALTADGRFLVASSQNNDIRVWDLESGGAEPEPSRPLRDYPPRCVAVSGDGRQVLYGTFYEQDKKGQADPIVQQVLAIWEVNTDDSPRRSRDLTQPVSCVACTPDGLHALTGGEDRMVRRWDLRGQSLTPQVIGQHKSRVMCAALSADGRYALSGGADTEIRWYDLENDKATKILKGHGTFVTCLAFSADGRRAVSGSRDKTARVWDLDSGNPICVVKHEGAVFGVAFAPDGKTFATVGDDKLVHVWNARTADEVRSFSGHTRTVQAVAYSFDGLYLLSVSEDNTARRWELKEGTR